jgi:pyridoxamine 5'-phosphate oxidase
MPKLGADIDAQQTAKSVLQYFNIAAHQHHKDEEHDLLPMLQTTHKVVMRHYWRQCCP